MTRPRARTIILKPDKNAPCPTCNEGEELLERMFKIYDVQKSYFTVKYMTDNTVPYKCIECNKYWATSDEIDNQIFKNKDVEKISSKVEMTVCLSAEDPNKPCCRAYHTKCYHKLVQNGTIKSKGRKRG